MAGTEMARAYVTVAAELQQLRTGLAQGQGMVMSSVGNMQKSLGGLQGMFGALGVGIGFGALVSQAKSMISEGQQAIDVQQQLEASLASTGNAVGFTGQQLADYASELQKVTTFGDEHIKQAMTGMLQFRHVTGETYKAAIRAALDYEAAGKGSASGMARMFGRALEMPERAQMMLTRMGVAFTNSEKERIKTLVSGNQKEQARQIVLEKIQSAYKGVAEEMAKTDSGKIKQLKEATGDLREEIGIKLMPLYVRWLEMQKSVTEGLKDFADKATPWITAIVDAWTKLNAAAGGWIGKGAMIVAGVGILSGAWYMFGNVLTNMVMPALTAVSAIFGAVTSVLGGLMGPIGLVIGGVIGLTYVWTQFTETGANVADAVATFFHNMWANIEPIIETFKQTFGGIVDAIHAGDWSLAGEIAVTGLKLAMVQGMQGIMNSWEGFTRSLVNQFFKAMKLIGELWIKTFTGISSGLLKMAQDKGIMGDVMAKVIGKDVRRRGPEAEYQFKDAQLSKARLADEGIARNKERIASLEQLGGKEEEIARLQAENAQFQATAANARAAMQDPDAIAAAAAGMGDTGEMLSGALNAGMNAAIGNLNTWADESEAAIQGAIDPAELAKKEEELQRRLSERRETAAKEREKKEEERNKKPKVAGAGKGTDDDTGKAGKSSPFIGFAELNKKIQDAMLKDPVLEATERGNELLEDVVENTGAEGPSEEAGVAGPAGAAVEVAKETAKEVAESPTEFPWQKRKREERERRDAAVAKRNDQADFSSVERRSEREDAERTRLAEIRKQREERDRQNKIAIYKDRLENTPRGKSMMGAFETGKDWLGSVLGGLTPSGQGEQPLLAHQGTGGIMSAMEGLGKLLAGGEAKTPSEQPVQEMTEQQKAGNSILEKMLSGIERIAGKPQPSVAGV